MSKVEPLLRIISIPLLAQLKPRGPIKSMHRGRAGS